MQILGGVVRDAKIVHSFLIVGHSDRRELDQEGDVS
jgi:hypothetical protein